SHRDRQPSPTRRSSDLYQNAREVLNDLEGKHASRARAILSTHLPGRRWAIAATATLFLSLGGYLSIDRVFFQQSRKQSASAKPRSEEHTSELQSLRHLV